MLATATTTSYALDSRITWKLRSEPHSPVSEPDADAVQELNQHESLIADNAAQSPLLRLPAELRSRIWQDLLTGQVIHIAQYKVDLDLINHRDSKHHLCRSGSRTWGKFEFNHAVCQHPRIEDEYYHASLWPRSDLGFSIPALPNHTSCMKKLERDHAVLNEVAASARTRSSLSACTLPGQLLRVCHKIYWETHTMLYNGNVFHFASPAEFFEWTYRAMSQPQRRALRSVQIRSSSAVQPLQGLRNLEPGTFTGLTNLTLILDSRECLLPGLPQNPFRHCRRLTNVRVLCGVGKEDRERAEEIEQALLRR